ncbi:MAG TPA: ABC transporter ATP-binding protein [Alphaproteobacteria bacterium]|nr:ABC transporter ATP-binding protein [Alphaproteobacteria bacterium]
MLEVKELSTGYGRATVVRGVDLAVPAGQIVALIGANGAGKSTLVKALSGLLPLHAGRILLNGEPIEKLSPRERVLRGIAHVPEGRQIFPGMTVADNLLLGTYTQHRRLDKAALDARVREVCQLFPILIERLAHPVGTLSGGQQQMLAIARGLMSRPKLLLLDEPSLGLAPILVAEIFRLIAELRTRGLAILLSEQNARLSLAMADHAYVMEMGKVVLEGEGRELLGKPEVAERYLGVGKAQADGSGQQQDRFVDKLRETLAL